MRRTSEKAKLVRPFTMPAFRIFLQPVRIDPGQLNGHHTKIQMVGHALRIPTLTLASADFLLQLLEAGLDLPAGAIILDDLCDRYIQVRGKHRDSAGFTEHPNDPHGALQ